MWRELWRILSKSDTLLDEARAEALGMLDLAQEMFEAVLEGMVEEAHEDCLERIAKMDRVLNEQQQEIRTKVFEHLALSKGSDLLDGLILTSIVIDLERIGDYTKNIGEAVCLLPAKLNFHEHHDLFDSVVARTRELFRKTRTAFESGDPEAARDHAEFYHGIKDDVDRMLRLILAAEAPDEMVEKWVLGLAFLLRYLKRTAAHLKNICTAISNPFPAIGFRPEIHDDHGAGRN
jgi:phosphate uptake regulator